MRRSALPIMRRAAKCRYFHPRRTVEESLVANETGRLHVHGVRAQRPETKRTGQGSLLFLRHKPEKRSLTKSGSVADIPFGDPDLPPGFQGRKIQPTHADYPDAVHWVAEREQVPLIDLQEMTRVLFEALGEEGSKGLSCIIRPVLIRGRTRLWPTTPISILTGHTR